MSVLRGLRRCGVALLLVIMGTAALACALCLNAFKVTLRAQDLVHAQRVVLAVPQGDGWRVVERIKGDGLAAGSIIWEPVARLTPDQAQGKPLLLIREDRWLQWVNMGAIGVTHADWLRELAKPLPVGPAGDERRVARVGFLLPSLESSEPMVADLAYGEIAAAPYGAMRANKAAIDLDAVRRWVADPALVSRHDLYVLLLGIAGDPADAVALERRLDAQYKAKDATHLGALLAADLELRGPSRLGWIEKRYLLDTRRSLDEQQAAVLGLGVQGDEDAAISRAQVIALYRRLLAQRVPAAGLAAAELAEWGVWDVAPAYRAWLKFGTPLPAPVRTAIQNYLDRAPAPRGPAAANPGARAPS